jgi:uncharacterized protein
MRTRISIAVAVALLAACSSSAPQAASTTASTVASTVASSTSAAPTTSTAAPATTIATTTAAFKASAAFQQVVVVDADPGDKLSVLTPDGSPVKDTAGVPAIGTVDSAGAALFRGLAPGRYVVRGEGKPAPQSEPVTVTDGKDSPPQSFYAGQKLEAPGYGYLKVRDGTTLSINIALPGPVDKGPYPTVVEYSGYDPSNPDNKTFAQLFTTLGYAYVGVNIRGTGCSGGSCKFFEPIESLDGYDVIETVAAQPWAAGNTAGMVGISYPGISQLFVARSQPPHLSAITPLSVLDDALRATLYPGGILNTGFAVDWNNDRQEQAKPRGQKWAAAKIDGGDTVCSDNQKLRLQNPDNLKLIETTPFYDAAIGDEISPQSFVGQIKVPVFLAGAWQDEQTGGRFPTMIDKFTSSPRVDVNLVNGYHTESLTSAAIFARYIEFLELYVAKRTPSLSRARLVYSVLAPSIAGVDPGALPADRFEGVDYATALKTFEAEPKVRINLEEGAAQGRPAGSPVPRFTVTANEWPIAKTVTRTFRLGSGGSMSEIGAAATGSTNYVADPTAVSATMTLPDGLGTVWRADNKLTWPPTPDKNSAVFVSPSFAANALLAGSASADLWVKTTAPDTDVEVTLSEERSDGQEMYIQSGWLRASHRGLDKAASTPTRPVQTHLKADSANLVAGEWTLMRVEVFPFAHAFRAGSKLRLTVSAPGGNRVQWAFKSIAAGETVDIAHDADHPSQLVVSEVPGATIPAGLPACGAVRNQPCRTPLAAP